MMNSLSLRGSLAGEMRLCPGGRNCHQQRVTTSPLRATSRRPVLAQANSQKVIDSGVYSAGSLSRRGLLASVGGTSALSLLPQGPAGAAPMTSTYDFTVKQYGEDVSLSQFKDCVTVFVNVARLRYLWDKYYDAGFRLVAFPCNQFGGQAPGTSEEEREYAYKKFRFEFPVMDKIEVNGPGADPIYKFMKQKQQVSLPNSTGYKRPGEAGIIEWNYTKFLVDRNGQPVKRLKPAFDPVELERDVQSLLLGNEVLPEECIMHPGRIVCKVDYPDA